MSILIKIIVYLALGAVIANTQATVAVASQSKCQDSFEPKKKQTDDTDDFLTAEGKFVTETDRYLWLEEVEGEKALNWVRERNVRTLAKIEGHAKYKEIEQKVRSIVLATDRMTGGSIRGDMVYNFWQDEKNVRGLWRRTKAEDYRRNQPNWEVLLDLDHLAKSENKNWVWAGSFCLPPAHRRCLLALSNGGKDATVVREYDLSTRSFVLGGFEVPEAKTVFSWVDENTLLVGTDFGPGSLTKSGYARQIRLWKRGEPLEKAQLIFEAKEDDLSANVHGLFAPEGQIHVIQRTISFWEHEAFLMKPSGQLEKFPVPNDANLEQIFKDHAFFTLQNDWQTHGQTYSAGSLVALPLSDLAAAPELVFAKTAKTSIQSVERTQDGLFIQVLENVLGRVYELEKSGSRWVALPTALPNNGSLYLESTSPFSNFLLAGFESFLTPPSQLFIDTSDKNAKPETVQSVPSRFETDGLVSEQLEAVSADGTRVPYFVVRPKDLKYNGSAPTLLYGYGGFNVSETPYYSGTTGKVWLEEGGVFVLANIRGGGEFGPEWHQAALKENRQKAYDDFIAIAEDLHRRKITSPEKLAIRGGSNGGLLVGAVMVQRPELFRAVICEVPLLDMLRFHKLLAGHSWTGEYGNPDDPVMAEIIKKYSPYQNLKKDVKYPTLFLMTSTKDDRVHPGHARKMAALMEEYGHEYEYYENIEGGHGGAANLEQSVHSISLLYTFLQMLK